MELSLLTGASTTVSEDRNGSTAVPMGASDHVVVPVGPEPQTPKQAIEASVPKTEGLAELDIRSLLWIEQPGNEVYARAYQEWEKKDLLFASRIDKKKKQSSSLRNENYQLIGFYSVFQGVLMTAVAQSSLLHCHNLWTALSLSLFASLVTIAAIMQKFWAILALEKTIQNEADTRQVILTSHSLRLFPSCHIPQSFLHGSADSCK